MPKIPLTIFEEYTGIDVKDLLRVSGSRQAAAYRALEAVNRSELEQLLLENDHNRPAPVYPSGELVPRVWRHRLFDPTDESGPPPNVTDPQDVCRALLYSHRVEIANPLIEALDGGATKDLVNGLRTLDTLPPLLEAGLVRIGRSAVTERRENWDVKVDALIDTAAYSAKGRAALLHLIPGLRELAQDVLAKDMPRDVGWRRQVDPVGSDSDLAEITHDLIEALRVAMHGRVEQYEQFINNWYVSSFREEARRNIAEMLSSMAGSHADVWLPPRSAFMEFLESIGGAPSVRMDSVLTWVTALPVAHLGGLDIRDLISIRLNSDAFEGWHDALRQSYEELERKVALGNLDDAREDAAEVLQDAAEQVLSRLRRDSGSLWPGELRNLVLGLAAAVPGAVIDGTEAATVAGIAGAAAGTAAGVFWDLLKPPRRRTPARALARHICALEPVIKGGRALGLPRK